MYININQIKSQLNINFFSIDCYAYLIIPMNSKKYPRFYTICIEIVQYGDTYFISKIFIFFKLIDNSFGFLIPNSILNSNKIMDKIFS